MVSPQCYVCGRLRGREAGRQPTSWGYYSTTFVFCNGVWRGPGLRRPPADGDGWFCLGLRPPSAKGLAWPAPLSRPHRPPTFLETGGLPLYPRRGLRPLHPAWGTERAWFAHLAAEYGGKDKMLPPYWTGGLVVACGPPSAGGMAWLTPLSRPHHPPTFLGTGGLAVPPAGAAPPAPRLGDGGGRCSSWREGGRGTPS